LKRHGDWLEASESPEWVYSGWCHIPLQHFFLKIALEHLLTYWLREIREILMSLVWVLI